MTDKRALTLSGVPVIGFAAFLDRSRFLHMRSCDSAASVHGREGEDMRKVRDYGAELRALGDKARTLKAKKVQQLGELVTSTGADAIDADVLTGALPHIVAEQQVEGNRESWRSDGATLFQDSGRKEGRNTRSNAQGGH